MTDQRELTWRTSSRSGGGNCVEVAFEKEAGLVHIRDSKDRSGPVLTVGTAAFQDFLAFVTKADATGR